MNKQIKITILLILMWFLFVTFSYATIVSNDPTVNSGEKVTITLTSSENVQAFKININNSNGLTFDSVSNNATFMGTPNGSNTSGISTTGGKTLATYTFTAPDVNQTTSYNVSFSGSISVDGSSWTAFSNTSKVTVKAPSTSTTDPIPTNPATPTTPEEEEELPTGGTGGTVATVKSSNNYLKTLTLSAGEISFNKKTTKYTINVEEGIEEVTIKASAEHEKATVSGIGKIKLEKGTNTAKVVVTAENGSARTYTLTIIRPGEEKIEEELPEEIIGLTTLSLKGIKDSGEIVNIPITPEFSTDIFYYECEIEEDIARIDVENATDILDAIIEITGNENLQVGDNLINIIIKYNTEDGEEKTITYQIAVKKLLNVQDNIIEVEKLSVVDEKDIALLVVAVICVIIIIILIVRYKKQNKEPWEETEFGTYGEPLYDEKELESGQETVETLEENQDNEVIDIAEEENKKYRKKRKGKHF